MITTKKLADAVKSPFLWAVAGGVLCGLLATSYLTGQLNLELTRGILERLVKRVESKTLVAPPKSRLVDIRKLASLSLWGQEGGEVPGGETRHEVGRLALPAGSSLVLKGIVRYPDGRFEAVFTGTRSKKSFVLQKGDKIGDAVILDIEPDKVIVSKNGQRSAYLLFHNKTGKSRRAKPGPRAANTAGRVTLNRHEVQTALSDMAAFLRQVRIVPYMKNGKPKGFQLLDIVPGSIVARVGLKNGDVVEKVNGNPIHSPQEAMKLFTLLQNGRGLTLEIERHGQSRTIAITLR